MNAQPQASDGVDDVLRQVDLLLQNPERFNTFYVFTDSERQCDLAVSQSLALARSQGLRSVLVPVSTGADATRVIWPPSACTAQANLAQWAADLQDACTAALLAACMGNDSRALLLLDLNHGLFAWVQTVMGQLSAFPADLDEPPSAESQAAAWRAGFANAQLNGLRAQVLSRLNERRELLAKRSPLALLLPLDWPKRAAMFGPDLWSVRLASRYVRHAGSQAEIESSSPSMLQHGDARHSAGSPLPADPDANPVLERLLAQWDELHAQSQSHRLVPSDGVRLIEYVWRTRGAALALALAQQAVVLSNAQQAHTDHWKALMWQGDLHHVLGESAAADVLYRQGFELSQRFAASDPKNTEWQRDVSISLDRIADVLLAQGDAATALGEYRKGLAIRERLAASDPKNTQWQRDVWVSLDRIADVLLAQGDAATALAEYRKGLAIAERRAASDPKNTEWQRDVAVICFKLGEVLKSQGKRDDALARYKQALVISERLSLLDPSNAQWKTDVRLLRQKVTELGPKP